jgi:hypothetical protein
VSIWWLRIWATSKCAEWLVKIRKLALTAATMTPKVGYPSVKCRCLVKAADAMTGVAVTWNTVEGKTAYCN